MGRGFFYAAGTREQYGTRCTASGRCGATAAYHPAEGLIRCSSDGGYSSGSEDLTSLTDDDEEEAAAPRSNDCWSYVYVPGAGDDEESWAVGLTPRLFWANYRVSE